MSHHTSFRQRKSGNNNDNKMKKMPSVRKCSTLNNTTVFHPFNNQGNLITNCITHSPQLLEDLAIIMVSLEAPLVGQEDTPQVGTPVEDTTTQTVEVKAEEVVMAVGLMPLKAEEHLMDQVACLVPVLVAVAEPTELAAPIIPKVVHMVAQGLAVVQT